MCNYNGRKVSKAEYIRLKELEKELGNAMNNPVGNGYDYSNWPIVLPTTEGGLQITMAHWELVPDFVYSRADLPAFRKKYNTLNARGETMLQSPLYREAALCRRCLVLSSHFFEYRHVGKERIPYRIGVRGAEYFYVAGIWQVWTDKCNGKSGTCFSMITTAANELMAAVHNTKRRMPTILPEEEAYSWLLKPLTETEIQALATYQLPADAMEAWTVAKDFRKSDDPEKEVVYEHILPVANRI